MLFDALVIALNETLKCHQISEKRVEEIKGVITVFDSETESEKEFEALVMLYLTELLNKNKMKPLTFRKIKFELKKQLIEPEEYPLFFG